MTSINHSESLVCLLTIMTWQLGWLMGLGFDLLLHESHNLAELTFQINRIPKNGLVIFVWATTFELLVFKDM